MKNNKYAFILAGLTLMVAIAPQYAAAQCEVTASTTQDTVVCGDFVTLTAFGRGQGQIVFQENFNSGQPTGWQFTQQAMFNNPCSPQGVDGTPHIWMGNSSAVPRSLVTQSYNFSSATAGVTICFDMLFATQGNSAPCEGPDEPDEGVYLQYSTNGGVTWNTIHYFDPNGGNDPTLINWTNWCFPLPPGGTTANTQIRWFQDNDSGSDYDHWGIDNVIIYFNDPTYEITWANDGFSYGVGNSGGTHDFRVFHDTTFIVTMSNGSSSCSDTLSIIVIDPTIELTAEKDTTLCLGNCVILDGTAKVIKRQAKTATYGNFEVQPVASIFGSTTEINVNVTNLNMQTIQPNSIAEVCITGLSFFGAVFFPVPGQISIGGLDINLVCPDGTKITLVPAGVTSSVDPFTGYVNTCFTVGGANIASASVPYSGNFAPNQPFNNFVGCTSNGLWTLEVVMTAAGGFGQGFFNGWTITFNDPEISAPADFSWAPTTGLNNPNIEDPTACPTVSTVYTLTASDTSGCVTLSDSVTITVDSLCCSIAIDTVTSTNPLCGQNDGTINIQVTGASGAVEYSINNGANFQSSNTFSGLPTGVYNIVVRDTGNCTDSATVTLNNVGGPVMNNVSSNSPGCGLTNGTITIQASGGTGTLQYSINGGTTFQPTGSFTGLAGGTYDIVVQDANNCQATQQVVLVDAQPPVIDSVVVVEPNCGAIDGSITIYTALSATIQYSIDGGTTFQPGPFFSSLAPGVYDVVVLNSSGCTATRQVSLSNSQAPPIDSIRTVVPSCGQNDGEIEIFSSGVQPLEYSIDSGATFQSSNTFTALPADTYYIVVRDNDLCTSFDIVILAASNAPVIDNFNIFPASCGLNNGTISINATGTVLEYSIDNGATFQPLATFTSLAGGTYNIVVRDSLGCTVTGVATVPATGKPVVTTSQVNLSCFGAADGQIALTITGGSGNIGFTWSPNVSNSASASGLAAGQYSITVSDLDAANCDTVITITLTEPAGLSVTVNPTNTRCDVASGTASVIVSGGLAPYGVTWHTGDTLNTVANLDEGEYEVTVTDAAGCSQVESFEIVQETIAGITAGPDTTIEGGQEVDLFVTGAVGNYTWAPTTGLSCIDCPNPVATPLETTVYNVIVTNDFGCAATDSVLIVVTYKPQIVIPSAFSPNNDGFNDVLKALTRNIDKVEFKIFNRWGQQIFETGDKNQGWDGTYKMAEQPVGVYVYYVNAYPADGSEPIQFAGTITLIR